MALYRFSKDQNIPASIDIVWDFISSPKNLERITPEYMQFKIKSDNLPEKIYPGTIIKYTVKPILNIIMNWVSEITHIKEKEYFIDEQRIGPYKMWHHEHKIIPIKGGTLMSDQVWYCPPMGIIGTLANKVLIKNNLNKIFTFREMALNEIFGEFNNL